MRTTNEVNALTEVFAFYNNNLPIDEPNNWNEAIKSYKYQIYMVLKIIRAIPNFSEWDILSQQEFVLKTLINIQQVKLDQNNSLKLAV